jgi:hypothetical protein
MSGFAYRDTGSDLVELVGETQIGSDLVKPIEEMQDTLSLDEVPVAILTPKQAEAMRRLGDIVRLSPNWDSYGSPPPTSTAVGIVMDLLLKIDDRNLPSAHVVPVSGGGVQLEWRQSDRELQLEISGDGTAQYLQVEHGRPFKEEEITPRSEQLRPLLIWLVPRAERWAA